MPAGASDDVAKRLPSDGILAVKITPPARLYPSRRGDGFAAHAPARDKRIVREYAKRTAMSLDDQGDRCGQVWVLHVSARKGDAGVGYQRKRVTAHANALGRVVVPIVHDYPRKERLGQDPLRSAGSGARRRTNLGGGKVSDTSATASSVQFRHV